jgi:tRNA(Ile)-lysidine synthase
MIKIYGELPERATVAVSGGVDSMAVLDFLRNSRSVRAAFFHHGTEASQQGMAVVTAYCQQHKVPLLLGRISSPKTAVESPEEYWRNQRYAWLDSIGDLVITAHHLDDCVETYLWSMLHGTAKTVPYLRGKNVIRPFILTPKSSLVAWAQGRGVAWSEDASNLDLKYTRNFVRHELVPRALRVNPGLHKVVARKVEEWNEQVQINI